MQIHILALSLLFLPFSACQQNQETALSSAANIILESSVASGQASEKTQPTATNIIFQSSDGGQSWQDVSAGLPIDLSVGRVFADGGEIFLTTEKTLYQSSTATATPSWEHEGFFDMDFYDMEISDMFHGQTGPYISSYGNGLFQKIPRTGVFISLHNALKDKKIRTVLETPDGTLFVGCESGIFKSTDSGQNWKQVFAEEGINSLVAAEGVLICGANKGLLRSTDGGEHWDWVLTEDGPAWKTGYFEGHFVSITEGGDWRDHPTNRLRMSADGGKTWQRIDENLASAQFIFNKEVGASPIRNMNDIKQAGKYLFCSCDAGIFRSSDWGKSWEPVFAQDDMKGLQLAVSGNVIYAVKVAGC